MKNIAKNTLHSGEAVIQTEEKSRQIWEYLMKNDPLITVWSRVCTCACRSLVKNDRNGTCEHANRASTQHEFFHEFL